MIFHAREIITGMGAPIRDGCLEVANGRITDVRPTRIGEGSATDRTDLGDVVLVPGFVNAHTHLELSHLHGMIPPGDDLIDWLERVVRRTIEVPPDEPTVRAAVEVGIRQSLACGVTTVADITRHPEIVRPLLAASPLGGVSFGEVTAIGRRRGQLERRLHAARRKMPGAERWRVGVSPHSPYTVEVDGLQACARAARADGLPLCIHLAESDDEEAFTRHAGGRLRDFLQRLDVWDDRVSRGGEAPVDLAIRCGLLTPRTIAAHVNFITDRQIERFAATGAHVAYCPRTHAAFGHPPHPFRRMIERGINVCIGTDGLASNPSLSVLDELRFLHRRHPDIRCMDLMDMGTARGARALDLGDRVGILAPGARADFVAIACGPAGHDDAATRVLESDGPITAYVAGQCVTTIGLVD